MGAAQDPFLGQHEWCGNESGQPSVAGSTHISAAYTDQY